MLEIGKLSLKSNLILAPMAGVTDLVFRMLNRRFGAELAFVEMINCRSISFKSRRTRQMLSSCSRDRPLGVQLLGCEEKFILRAIEVLRGYKFDLLDFNAACPAKKVVRRGEGAALLKEPKKLAFLLKLIIKHSAHPVSVKIRSGWDKDSVNARDIALIAEDAGANAIFIHGRTRMQEYGGNVDYEVISLVKKAVKIPVIGSGDILSPLLAKRMFDKTGCDGIAIARGALGNPWIFKRIKTFIRKPKALATIDKKEILKVMSEHLDDNVEFYGERNGVMLFRKFFSYYTKGFRDIRPLREKSSRAKTIEEMNGIIERINASK